MLETQYYNLIDAIIYVVAIIIPAYFILKSRNSINNNHLTKLTIILIAFILMQVLYHIVGNLGFRLLAKGFRTILHGGIAFVWSNVSYKYV